MRIDLNAFPAALIARAARAGVRLAPILLLAAMFAAPAGAANTCTSKGNAGNWSSSGTWRNCGGNAPGYQDTAVIDNNDTVTLDINTGAITSLVINSGGKLVGTSGRSLNVNNITNNSAVANSIALDGVIVARGGLWTGAAGGSWTIKGITLEGDVRFSSGDSFTINLTGAAPIGGYGSVNSDSANKTVTLNYSANSAQIIDATYASRVLIYPNLSLSGGGTKTAATDQTNWGGNITLNVLGNLTIGAGATFAGSGAGNISNPIVNLYGNFTYGGAGFSSGSNVWTLVGGAAQSVSGAPTFTKLTVNNSSGGVSLAGDVTVGTLLTLSQGVVTTGANVLVSGSDCQSGVTRSGGYVDGNLRYTFPNPSAGITCTYHVGSGGSYAPVGVQLNSTGGATLTASTTTYSHPSIASSGINAALDVNRYWSLWRVGDTLAVSSYAATFNFPSGEIDGGATWANFVLGKYTGGAWTTPGSVTVGATSIGVSNVAGPLSAVTDFVAGEAAVAVPACAVPVGYASCICDTFARDSLNPSPIFNNDWVVGHSSGSFGDPAIVSGKLRLTSTAFNIATVATLPGMFPAAGNKIAVEFLQYAYGGAAPGADGMALTLSDAGVTQVAGAYGGSLGYAQKTNINGFAGGWLGVGFDEYGNFASYTEGRASGSGSLYGSSQSVSLRGSGSGSSGASTNYPFLATSGYLNTNIDNHVAGHLYRVTVDATGYTWNGSSGDKVTAVKVERDTSGTGNSYTTLPNLNLTNIYTNNASQAVVPANWKISFTGSTGSSSNTHEISALKVCSTYFTAPGSFTIESNATTGLSCATYGGTPPPPIITVTARDSLGALNATYVGAVTLSAKVGSTLSNTVSWRRVGTGATIANGAAYTFVAGDGGSAQFYLIDSAAESLTLTANDAQASTTLASPVAFSNNASIAITSADAAGPVAGRPQRLKAQYYSTGCASAVSPGSLPVSAWYEPSAFDPGGAAPRFCAASGSGSGATCFDASATGIPSCGAQAGTSAPASSNLTLAFDASSVAYFCLQSTDVGQYTPKLRVTATPSIGTAASDTLTLPPFAVAVTNLNDGAGIANPVAANVAASANNGDRFTGAGRAFQATVGGYLWNFAGDANNDGFPDAAASQAQVTAAGFAPHYADAVTLAAGAPFGPAVVPVPAGVLANGGVVINAGANQAAPNAGRTTQATLAYNEVGAFTLGATVSDKYLNVGRTASFNNRIVYFAGGANQNRVVGRFFPDHFRVTASNVGYGCGAGATGFTYQGQPFALGFTIEAQNAANGRTSNYGAAGYAPLADGVLTLVAENADAGANLNPAVAPRLAAPAVIPGWNAGQYVVNGINTFTRAAAAEAPFATPFAALALGLTMADNSGDAVALAGMNMRATAAGDCVAAGDCDAVRLAMADGGASVNMRWGRMRVDNAYGSERLPLRVNLEAQFWDGNGFVRNALDNCTSLAAAQFALAAGSGAAIATAIVDSNATLTAGAGAIRLTRPGNSPARTGSVVLSTGAPLSNFLPGSGRETFGVYKSGPVIYIREMF